MDCKMKFTIVKEPIPFLIIDDTYDSDELLQIYKEIDFLANKLLDSSKSQSAEKNGIIKNNRGIFLDHFYKDLAYSDILKIERKLYSQEVVKNLVECHYAYNVFHSTNFDSTLLSYYDDGSSYFSHHDKAVISMVTWLFKEPKNFIGGEFIFSDFNLNIDVKNNRTVIFFGSYKHEVTEVLIQDKTALFSGRFSLTQFLAIK